MKTRKPLPLMSPHFLLPCVVVLGIWGLAYVRIFLDPTWVSPLVVNWTPSLPYRMGWLERDAAHIQRGDVIVYSFDGLMAVEKPGLKLQPFFKVVAGVPGDRVSVSGREVAVAGEVVGTAKDHTFEGRPLNVIPPGVIPPKAFYVKGTSPDSFDSRYLESGLVAERQVIGRVHVWF